MSTELNSELSRLRNVVFQEVGRNVVMFQDIERMLKILLNRGRITTTASQLKAWKDKAPAPYAKSMLGELIKPLIDHHLTPAQPDESKMSESKEITVGFEFRIELTDAQREDFRARLEAMVKQRNEFIHHLLDWLRLETPEECQSARSRLQVQRDEIEPLYRDIRNFLEVLLESQRDTASYLEKMVAELKANDSSS